MGNPLRDFRKSRRLTLGDIGGRVGVTPGQMSRIERFGTTSLDMALKLAEITELPAETFVRRDRAA